MTFQILFASATLGCLFYFMIAARRSALQRLFVLAFFGTGAVLILVPELATKLAKLVGVGRGVDLVLYLTTLFLLFIVFNFYLRFKQIESEKTVIIRELAILRVVSSQTMSPPADTVGQSSTDKSG